MLDKNYHNILGEILDKGALELNERTGEKVISLPHLRLSYDISEEVPTICSRQIYMSTAAAEVAWLLSGTKSIDWLAQHTKIWNNFTEGGTSEVAASYGYRLRHHFDRDQLASSIKALVQDPSDRQIVNMIWDPNQDGLGNKWSKNMPCPVMFILNIIDSKLNLQLVMRSSDIIAGLPYDMLCYSMLLVALAKEIDFRREEQALGEEILPILPGKFTVDISHGHIYAKHKPIAERMLANRIETSKEETPGKFTNQSLAVSVIPMSRGIERDPDGFVKYISEQAKKKNKSWGN